MVATSTVVVADGCSVVVVVVTSFTDPGAHGLFTTTTFDPSVNVDADTTRSVKKRHGDETDLVKSNETDWISDGT